MVDYFLITDGHYDVIMSIHEGRLGLRKSWVIEPFFTMFDDAHVEFLRNVESAFSDDDDWGHFPTIILPSESMKVNGFRVRNVTMEYQSSYDWKRIVLDKMRRKGEY